MFDQQRKYTLDLIFDALTIKIGTIHMSLEDELSEDIWYDYDKRFLDVLNLIDEAREENR